MKRRSIVMAAAAAIGIITVVGPTLPASAVIDESIVGRWQQTHKCEQLVDALNELGLGSLAPGVVGDYFPNQTFDELAAKPDLCSGARPQKHSHFFTASGEFGSLDQKWNQVDDGTYVVVDDNTFRIGEARFDYSIRGGLLSLTPRITEELREDALADPKAFTVAGWMVAVAYPGTTWKGVSCGWC